MPPTPTPCPVLTQKGAGGPEGGLSTSTADGNSGLTVVSMMAG